MALNLQMPKGRKREGETEKEQSTTMQTIILWRLLSSCLSLLLLSPVRVRVRVFLGSTIFEYFPIFLSFILPSIFISLHLYLFVFLLLIFLLFIFFTAIFNFQLLICQKTEIFASQNSHTYIYPWLFFIDFSTSCLQAKKKHTNVYFNCFFI